MTRPAYSRDSPRTSTQIEGVCGTVRYDGHMNALAAQVWHFWLAVPLAIGTVLGVLQLVAGYIVKVVAPRYPKR